MYKQFILPALLFVFTSVAALAQSTAAPAGGTPQKRTSTEKSTSNGRQQPTEARTAENLPKGAKVKRTPSQKGKSKGKAKGHTKNKAQGKSEGHRKDDATGSESHEHHDGEHHQNDGTEMKKTETPGTTPNKGETTPVRKTKKPAKSGQPQVRQYSKYRKAFRQRNSGSYRR